jgi:hypothetical protein
MKNICRIYRNEREFMTMISQCKNNVFYFVSNIISILFSPNVSNSKRFHKKDAGSARAFITIVSNVLMFSLHNTMCFYLHVLSTTVFMLCPPSLHLCAFIKDENEHCLLCGEGGKIVRNCCVVNIVLLMMMTT